MNQTHDKIKASYFSESSFKVTCLAKWHHLLGMYYVTIMVG
uniref:Uncharacterized protein n=1 Tax=Rhizophora mucronata TaxID=61149 RepID=A0A2P2Q191_RHIMU